jgi:Tol biopolymer transport system component
MWTSDGSKLVFASNRFNRTEGDTNLFLADWVD